MSAEVSEAIRRGLPPDEGLPRAETWLHERDNWQSEVSRLREHALKMENLAIETLFHLENKKIVLTAWGFGKTPERWALEDLIERVRAVAEARKPREL